jgi:hypothetical protein
MTSATTSMPETNASFTCFSALPRYISNRYTNPLTSNGIRIIARKLGGRFRTWQIAWWIKDSSITE